MAIGAFCGLVVDSMVSKPKADLQKPPENATNSDGENEIIKPIEKPISQDLD